MNTEKRVIVKEVSSKGHDEHDFDLKEALDYIREATTKSGKWFYMDNKFTNPGEITIEDLANSQDLVLTNGLVGGE